MGEVSTPRNDYLRGVTNICVSKPMQNLNPSRVLYTMSKYNEQIKTMLTYESIVHY